jgi:hypothetical protein
MVGYDGYDQQVYCRHTCACKLSLRVDLLFTAVTFPCYLLC